MKSYYLRQLFLPAALAINFFAHAQTTLKSGFEFDLGIGCSIPAKSSATLTSYFSGGGEVFKEVKSITPAFNVSVDYNIQFNKYFSLVPGISYFFIQQNTSRYDKAYNSNPNDNGIKISQVKVNNHCIAAGIGFRLTFGKFGIENGLNYLYNFAGKGTGELYFSYGAVNVKTNNHAGFLQSFHKVGYRVTSHFAVYGGINLIYAPALEKDYMYSIAVSGPMSGLYILPNLSVKFCI